MTSGRFELTQYPSIKKILLSRWMQWMLVVATLPFFVLAIMAGLLGTPSGSRNFSTIFVWVMWWALLMLILVPLAGRFWCAACPIPALGEWLQRRTFIQPCGGGKLYTLGWKWPRWLNLNGAWLQSASFLVVALFAKVILTTPLFTSLALLSLAAIAVVTSLLFERRIFCRYICPVGGFIALYSQSAPIEVRVKDRALCTMHKEKTCYTGNDRGYGCPWLIFPPSLNNNAHCGMCTECFKTCPLDNIALYVRPFGADLFSSRGWGLGEAYRSFIMLASVPVYASVFMSPWSTLKEAAYAVGSVGWWLYAIGLLVLTLVIVPGIFFSCVAVTRLIARTRVSMPKLFVEYAYILVPLGLAAWVTFSLSFILINVSYVWPVVSDPFGWGWDLFGTANWRWTPYLADWQPLMQVPILLIGLVTAIGLTLHITREQQMPQLSSLPVVAFCFAFTLLMLWLYV